MNNKQALKASEWNPAGVNKVLEKLDNECPRCKGDGLIEASPSYVGDCFDDRCLACNGSGKIHYSWQPKVGEFYLLYGKLNLVTDPLIEREKFAKALGKDGIKPIPILEWEIIKRILRKARLELQIYDIPEDDADFPYGCRISNSYTGDIERGIGIEKYGESLTRVVYEAVIDLGKELK